jgi:hypothetical protein
MTIRDQALWSFETARFFVGFYAEPEEMDPADSFQFDDDIEAVRSGSVEWFSASVRVYLKGDDDNWCTDWTLVGRDDLGGCAYSSVREFYTSHRDPDPMNRNCSTMRAVRGENVVICHYFPGMVAEAISDARRTIRNVPAVRSAA